LLELVLICVSEHIRVAHAFPGMLGMLGPAMNFMGGARGLQFLPSPENMRNMAAPFTHSRGVHGIELGGAEEGRCRGGSAIIRDGVITRQTSAETRLAFVRKVYMIVLSQLLLTMAVAGLVVKNVDKYWVNSNTWALGLSVALSFGSLLAISCWGNAARTFPKNYVLLYSFTTFVALTLGFLSATVPGSTVVFAVVITGMVVFSLTVYAWTTSTSFVGYMPFVMVALSTLGSLGFALFMIEWCFGIYFPWMVVMYNAAGVMLFAFYIVFDTQRIIGEWGGHDTQFAIDDYAFAALSLYIDIVNFFMHLLSLMRYYSQRTE